MGTRGISLTGSGMVFAHDMSDVMADNDANFIQQEDSFSGAFCNCPDGTMFVSQSDKCQSTAEIHFPYNYISDVPDSVLNFFTESCKHA
jgi:hypothetical protein